MQKGGPMRSQLTLLAVALVATAGAAPHRPAPVLKCEFSPSGSPTAPENVFVLNGKAVEEKQIKQLAPKSVESIEMVCAEELRTIFGIEARRIGVVVFTTPGPSSALRSSLESISALQRAHFAKHRTFAAQLSDLGWSDPPGLVRVDLQRTQDGERWSATGRHRYLIGESFARTVSGEKESR
jgi:hypothetical protein